MAESSYWGMRVTRPRSPVWDKAGVQTVIQDLRNLPEAMRGVLSTKSMEGIATPRESMERGLAGSLDALSGGLGTIIGRGAKSFDDQLVKETQRLMASGYTAKQATKKTGYFQDLAGNWKSQISDVSSELLPSFTTSFQNYRPARFSGTEANVYQLKNVWSHPELFREYPYLASRVEVKFTPHVKYGRNRARTSSTTGEFVGSTIEINPTAIKRIAREKGVPEEEVLMDFINHEVNHSIQAHDYIPGGSTKDWFTKQKKQLPEVRQQMKVNKIKYNEMKDKNSPEANKLLREISRQSQHVEYFDKVRLVDDELLYQNTIGEADAFWSAAKRKDPNVVEQIPSHYDPTQGTQLLDSEASSAFYPEYATETSPHNLYGRVAQKIR